MRALAVFGCVAGLACTLLASPTVAEATASAAQFAQAIEDVGTPPFGFIRNGEWFGGGADVPAHWQRLSAQCAKYEGQVTQRFEHGTYEFDPGVTGGWAQIEDVCAGK